MNAHYSELVHKLAERWWGLLTMGILVGITVLSLTPLPALPSVPGSDKTHHLVAYGLLMAPAFVVRFRWRFALFCGFLCWSGAIELIQPWVNRYGEWGDFLANAVGLSIGATVGCVIRRQIFH